MVVETSKTIDNMTLIIKTMPGLVIWSYFLAGLGVFLLGVAVLIR